MSAPTAADGGAPEYAGSRHGHRKERRVRRGSTLVYVRDPNGHTVELYTD
jgi:catechol 2,3-dioxygenase-like lactoylglutathione lyase family enzyme